MLNIYKEVARCRLWLWTAVSISLSVFMQTGINYLWQNTVLNIWRFTSAQVTISLNLFTGVGGGIGNAVGPMWLYPICYEPPKMTPNKIMKYIKTVKHENHQ